MVAGVPAAARRICHLRGLAALPQITTTIQNDSNFADQPYGADHGRAAGQAGQGAGRAARRRPDRCALHDRYRSHYPAKYIAQHHPIFVLKINGLRPRKWAAKRTIRPRALTSSRMRTSCRAYSSLACRTKAQIPDNVSG